MHMSSISKVSQAKSYTSAASVLYQTREDKYNLKGDLAFKEVHVDGREDIKTGESFAEWTKEVEDKSRANARILEKYEMALPVEFNRAEQIEVTQRFIKNVGNDRLSNYAFAIHDNGNGNPHVHISFIAKDKETGKTILPLTQSYLKKDTLVKFGYSEQFDGKGNFKIARQTWEDTVNQFSIERGKDVRIDHRSYQDQGIEKSPSMHRGVEQRNEKTEYRKSVEQWNTNVHGVEHILRNLDDNIAKTLAVIDNIRIVLNALDKAKEAFDKVLKEDKKNEIKSPAIDNEQWNAVRKQYFELDKRIEVAKADYANLSDQFKVAKANGDKDLMQSLYQPRKDAWDVLEGLKDKKQEVGKTFSQLKKEKEQNGDRGSIVGNGETNGGSGGGKQSNAIKNDSSDGREQNHEVTTGHPIGILQQKHARIKDALPEVESIRAGFTKFCGRDGSNDKDKQEMKQAADNIIKLSQAMQFMQQSAGKVILNDVQKEFVKNVPLLIVPIKVAKFSKIMSRPEQKKEKNKQEKTIKRNEFDRDSS